MMEDRFRYRDVCSVLLLLTAALVSGLILAAQTKVPPSSHIIAIDPRTGVVTANVNAGGEEFQFTLNNPALLRTLRAGQGVYANFRTRQVSLDGKIVAGTIVSIGPLKEQPAPTPTSKPATPPASLQPQLSPKGPGSGAPPAKARPPEATPQPSAASPSPGTSAPCCGITSIDTSGRLVTAQENATARHFQFSVPGAISIQALKAGQDVWANFKTRQVSLDGRTACCPIVSAGVERIPAPVGDSSTPNLSAQEAPPHIGAEGNAKQSPTAPAAAAGTPNLSSQGQAVSAAALKSPREFGDMVPIIGKVSLSQTSVIGGTSTTGTVGLGKAVGGLPIAVNLQASDPAVRLVPSQISIPVGGSSSSFTINTSAVAGNPDTSPPGLAVSITASLQEGGGIVLPARLMVLTPILSAFGFHLPGSSGACERDQAVIVGGRQGSACVMLTGPAPKGGLELTLASDHGELLLDFPTTLTVAEDEDHAAFVFSTKKVATPTSVSLSASRSAGNYKTAKLTLDPPPVMMNVYFNPDTLPLPGEPGFNPTTGVEHWYPAYVCICFSDPPDPSYGDPPTVEVSLMSNFNSFCGGDLYNPYPPALLTMFIECHKNIDVAGKKIVTYGIGVVNGCNGCADKLSVTYNGKSLSAILKTPIGPPSPTSPDFKTACPAPAQ